ncbi:hypothetical protein PLESTB_000151600 [Pleodorina starrii]|uniref:DSBA-like thioredoxin domain-containing protein n=1 Tax=Pleodorina starrii TaxID=330485 RepID=A0A9W6BB46_9CHLO|nr:hypothetical protein PLESTM_000450400 [Pleodorina starrii]GLC48814.1 hypothetical protein PLESTB_000151600 [Pleodorina starrii]GLC72553.1 hypothetical protein PLESTF_001264100 [Pleodorina starrii]
MMQLRGALSGPGASPQAVSRSGPLPPVTIHVFSDIACPWCHIGARRLQRAIRQYKRRYGQAAPIKLQWNPLLIDGDVTTAGEDVDSYAQRRWGFGSIGPIRTRLVRAGLPEGASFNNWAVMPNSLLALELMALAGDMGLAEQANDLLFARTYEQGGNVSLLDELLDIGESLGMKRGEVARELMRSDGSSLRAQVLERDAAAKRRLRIKAVPHFIITAGPKCRTKYSLNGAHQTSDLVGAMERVAMEEARADAAAGGYGTAGVLAGPGPVVGSSSVLIAC